MGFEIVISKVDIKGIYVIHVIHVCEYVKVGKVVPVLNELSTTP
jgi:hypothetical protein